MLTRELNRQFFVRRRTENDKSNNCPLFSSHNSCQLCDIFKCRCIDPVNLPDNIAYMQTVSFSRPSGNQVVDDVAVALIAHDNGSYTYVFAPHCIFNRLIVFGSEVERIGTAHLTGKTFDHLIDHFAVRELLVVIISKIVIGSDKLFEGVFNAFLICESN